MVRLKTIIQDGWPINRNEVPLDLMVYYHIRDELAVDGDVILKGLDFAVFFLEAFAKQSWSAFIVAIQALLGHSREPGCPFFGLV